MSWLSQPGGRPRLISPAFPLLNGNSPMLDEWGRWEGDTGNEGDAEIVCESSPQVVGIKRREPSRTACPSAFVQRLCDAATVNALSHSGPVVKSSTNRPLRRSCSVLGPGDCVIEERIHTKGLKAIDKRQTLKCSVKQGQDCWGF